MSTNANGSFIKGTRVSEISTGLRKTMVMLSITYTTHMQQTIHMFDNAADARRKLVDHYLGGHRTREGNGTAGTLLNNGMPFATYAIEQVN